MLVDPVGDNDETLCSKIIDNDKDDGISITTFVKFISFIIIIILTW